MYTTAIQFHYCHYLLRDTSALNFMNCVVGHTTGKNFKNLLVVVTSYGVKILTKKKIIFLF